MNNEQQASADSVKGNSARSMPPLIAAVISKAAGKGETLAGAARVIGVNCGYLAQLRDGTRHIENISREVAEAIADYLEVPAVLVLLLSGKIQAKDFILPRLNDEGLNAELQAMYNDLTIGALMPPAIWASGAETKRFVLMLYHEAKGQLLENQRRLPLALEELLRASLVSEECSLGQ